MNINNSHAAANSQGAHGKSAESPAFKARAAIEGNAELGSQSFGQIVSKVARGIPLDAPPAQEETTTPTQDPADTGIIV